MRVKKFEGLSENDGSHEPNRNKPSRLDKHLTLYEAAYFGHVCGRPYPEQAVPTLDGDFRDRDFMWVTEHEARADIMAAYQRACLHADATIESLPIDAAGHVSWWRSDVSLFTVLVHMLTETSQHLGHADIIREAMDGAVGANTAPLTKTEEVDWQSTGRWTKLRPVKAARIWF